MLCRHCGQIRASRPRGLCWACYYTPGMRERYPSTSKFARRGAGLGSSQVRPAAAPTRALPGTAEKVAILQQRAILHQELWHPLDAPARFPVGQAMAHAG